MMTEQEKMRDELKDRCHQLGAGAYPSHNIYDLLHRIAFLEKKTKVSYIYPDKYREEIEKIKKEIKV